MLSLFCSSLSLSLSASCHTFVHLAQAVRLPPLCGPFLSHVSLVFFPTLLVPLFSTIVSVQISTFWQPFKERERQRERKSNQGEKEEKPFFPPQCSPLLVNRDATVILAGLFTRGDAAHFDRPAYADVDTVRLAVHRAACRGWYWSCNAISALPPIGTVGRKCSKTPTRTTLNDIEWPRITYKLAQGDPVQLKRGFTHHRPAPDACRESSCRLFPSRWYKS